MLPEKAFLHVGLHKTGSTSIQAFLDVNRTALTELGICFYRGMYIPGNHVELHVATMRPERLSPFKSDHDLTVDDAYRSAVFQRVQDHLASCATKCALFSAEGLSYLRHPDEMDRLRSLVPCQQIEIVIYLRDPTAYLTSYRRELTRHRLPEVIDRDSFAYASDDSWLIDFDRRVGHFREAFGDSHVTVVDYDGEMQAHGNVIPSFLRVMGVEHAFDAHSWNDMFLNRHGAADEE